MIKTLFIGSFLSKTRGTIGISEKLARSLKTEGIIILLSSTSEPKWHRLLEIIYHCVFFPGKVVHVDVFSGRAFNIAEIASTISRYRGKKIIMTLHGGKLPEFYQLNPIRVVKLFRKADHILSPSLYLKKFFEKTGQNIAYLPNSIDLSKFPYAFELVKEPKLLWVRAFSPIYKPELAVQTLQEVRHVFPTATLTMIGPDKGELSIIQDLLKELDLEDSVNIVGPVPNEDLHEYYHSHRVFLNTTVYESFGVAVMEAAACGIPIVSTPAGEIPILWKNEDEILITTDWSKEAMAKEVFKILGNQELARKLSMNARKKAVQFDWEFIKPKWFELLTGNGFS